MAKSRKSHKPKAKCFILENRERPIPLPDFAKLPEIDRTYDSVKHWVIIGLRVGRRGPRVQLEGCYGTRGLCTSMEAYWRFLERLNGG